MAYTLHAMHLTLTLDGTAQQLGTATGFPELKLRKITIQPDGANGNAVYVGGNNGTLSSSNYGVRLPASAASEPCAPYESGEFTDGAMGLDDFVVLGTNTQKVHLFLLTYI